MQLEPLFREPHAARARLVALCSVDLKSQGASNVGDEMTEVSRNGYAVHVGWRAPEPLLSERVRLLMKLC